MRYDTIVCIDDLLRDDFWPAKEFVYDLVRMPVFNACGVDIAKSPRRGQRSNLKPGFDVQRFQQLVGRAGDPEAWLHHYHAIPKAAADYLAGFIPPRALVMGYEMPDWLQKTLDERAIDWLDLRMSPLRFGADLYIGLRTSSPALYAAVHAHAVRPHEVATEAALLAARLRYRLRYEKIGGLMDQQCVWIGQTESDASLLDDQGRFVRAEHHAETLKKLAATGPLHYKPHPMAGDFARRERESIEQITGRKTLLCELDTYELLVREENMILVGLSSGVLQEAAWFGREAYALFRPISVPRFEAEHSSEGCLQIASHVFLSQPLWSSVMGTIGQQPPVVLPPRPNHLRELHNTWWGYSTVMLRHNEFQREAFGLAGGNRLGDALKRCEAELAQTKAELAELRQMILAGRSAEAPTHLPRRPLPQAA